MACLLSQGSRVLVLDEPATNLSATAQQRLSKILQTGTDDTQVLLITHSPQLVPAREAGQLGRVVRLRETLILLMPFIVEENGSVVWSGSELLNECELRKGRARQAK